MRVAIALFALFAVAADASTFEPRPITEAEKETIRQAVKKKLTDPASAQFRWNPEVRDPVVYCGFVNSKNRMGGYAGHSPFMVFFQGAEDRRLSIAETAKDDSDLRVLGTMCGRKGYNLDPADLKTIDDQG